MGDSIVRNKGEGKAYWMLGGLYEVRIGSEETGGTLTVMEITVPPAALGSPPHTHAGAETFYVLDGKVRCHIEDRAVEVGPGAVVHYPKGTWEWFENVGNQPARLLVTYSPGGEDKFFAEAAEPARSRELPPPPTTPPDFERLSTIAKKYGLQIKRPPGM